VDARADGDLDAHPTDGNQHALTYSNEHPAAVTHRHEHPTLADADGDQYAGDSYGDEHPAADEHPDAGDADGDLDDWAAGDVDTYPRTDGDPNALMNCNQRQKADR
jgi:hypothetical protein